MRRAAICHTVRVSIMLGRQGWGSHTRTHLSLSFSVKNSENWDLLPPVLFHHRHNQSCTFWKLAFRPLLRRNKQRPPIVFVPSSMAEETSVPENSPDSSSPENRLDFGKLQYGCEHYRRRCRIRSPCCNRIFTCRHCHNDAMSSLSDPMERHELVRLDVTRVICAVCDTEQPVAKVCSNCGANMGEYFCDVCKFYDDETDKKQFHCDECGICRVGGRENFFHCQKCGSCYSVSIRDNHLCVENAMKNYCPICYEYLFDSIKGTTVMRCGHTIHVECYYDMLKQKQYRCPICSKSTVDMSRNWERLNEEIGATAMPAECRYEVLILCNDCSSTSRVKFHVFGHKCSNCNSYNTRVTQKLDSEPQSSSDG